MERTFSNFTQYLLWLNKQEVVGELTSDANGYNKAAIDWRGWLKDECFIIMFYKIILIKLFDDSFSHFLVSYSILYLSLHYSLLFTQGKILLINMSFVQRQRNESIIGMSVWVCETHISVQCILQRLSKDPYSCRYWPFPSTYYLYTQSGI